MKKNNVLVKKDHEVYTVLTVLRSDEKSKIHAQSKQH